MNPAMMGSGGGMPMPGAMGAPGGKKKKEVRQIPKIFKDDKKNWVYWIVNKGFAVVYIVWDFSKKLLWVGSCLAFMFLVPMSFEIFNEQ